MEHISKHLEVKQSQELQRQELPKPANGDEQALVQALSGTVIRSTDLEEIKQVLRFVMIKIGLRAQNWPEDEEKQVLIAHIIENYGGHTADEIKVAFEMAVAGKLQLERKEVYCYENFSCAYFSTIMNAYRVWSADAARQIIPAIKPEQKIFTQDELDDSAREDAERQYQLFIQGHSLKGLEFNKNILEKDGLLQDGQTVIQFFNERRYNGHRNIYVKQ